ncbi:DUF2332 domain-containing protein [Arthrobacter sp. Ld5]|uniref:DUF2332 domain-containing protein n=1 Tax=Arthrobacter sp. Ld5 TaxID=649152 RepID=UPI003EC0E1E8
MTETEATTAERYRRFAAIEARGYSPLYDEWCTGIADDDDLLARLDTLAPERRQPVLFLGAARFVGVPLGDYSAFRSFVLARWASIRDVVETRTTQTNEAGRCAVLLPLLAAISADEGRPLALIEVGASAGLCLYPDRYAYAYTPGPTVRPRTGSPVPPLECAVSGDVPLPSRLPEVTWRAGIDLNPLDARNEDDVRWLEALVWPEHAFRAERLRTALDVVRADPPLLVRGDLNEHIEPLVERAPRDAVVVVFHSAVLPYLGRTGRDRFARTMLRLAADRTRPLHWLSHEGHRTLTGVPGAMQPAPGEQDGLFVLQHNGRSVARTGPHGQSIAWLQEVPDRSG